MAVAGLQRVKLAKQKNKKGRKKEAMSAIQSHKRLMHFFFFFGAELQLFHQTFGLKTKKNT